MQSTTPRMLVSSVGSPARQFPPSATRDDVGSEQLPVTVDQEGEVVGARLLLALDQDLHRDRAAAAPRAQRGGVQDDAALVVGRASPVQTAVAHLGFERRARPLLERSLGLDVVVRVEQDRRRAGGTRDLAEHGRVIDVGELDQPDAAVPRRLERLGGRLGGLAHGLVVVAGERDRRDADEVRQLLDGAWVALGDRGAELVGVHGAERYRVRERPTVGRTSRSRYGQSRSTRQVSPSRVKRNRSWRRCSRPCQNSIVSGSSR